MIFDNNINEDVNDKNSENTNIKGEKENLTETINLTDKINQMLFSQANTPIKTINPKLVQNNINNLNSINKKNQNLLSNEDQKKEEIFKDLIDIENYNKKDENKSSDFNKKEEDGNSGNKKTNLITNNLINQGKKVNDEVFSKNENIYEKNKNEDISLISSEKRYFQISNNKNFTPLKKHQTLSIISSSLRSNISRTFGLNSLSLNLVHRGLIIYHNNKKIHFRSRVFKGPPVCLRWVSWLVLNNIPIKRDDNIIDYYISKNIDKDLDKLILKDIDRTFSELNSNYINEILLKNSLYRILKAYAALDTEIGYCQGINLITAFLLIVCNYNEKDVFYILISILSNTYGDNFIIRGFFSDEFPVLKLYLYYFEEIFERYNKKLKDHFDKLDLPLDTWVSKWFQTLFTICLPVEMCQRIWDCLFSYGPYFIFSFTLAFLKELESTLFQKTENIEILDFFNNMQKNLANENALPNYINKNNTKNINEIFNLNNKKTDFIPFLKMDKYNNNIEFKNNINKYNFSLENVIKQALKIKLSEKFFFKLKRTYLIKNNIEKDFTEDKHNLKINLEELENNIKEITVDHTTNRLKSISSYLKNSNQLFKNNTPTRIENNTYISNIISEFNTKNNLNNKFDDIYVKKINLHNIPEDNDDIKDENINNIKFSVEDEIEKDFNIDNNQINSGEKIKNINRYNFISLQINNEKINSNKEETYDLSSKNTKDQINNKKKNEIEMNNINDIVISLENLSYSPRFKTTTASSKNQIEYQNNDKLTKKSIYEKAIINTDINLDLDFSNLKHEGENSSKFYFNKNLIKYNTCQMNLKTDNFDKVKKFNVNDFEEKVNNESIPITINDKKDSNNLNFDANKIIDKNFNFELDNKNNLKYNFFTIEENGIYKKDITRNLNNIINNNIIIDNKKNKITLKTESDLLLRNIKNGFESFGLKTTSDIRKSDSKTNNQDFFYIKTNKNLKTQLKSNIQIKNKDSIKMVSNYPENIKNGSIEKSANKKFNDNFNNNKIIDKSNILENNTISNTNNNQIYNSNYDNISYVSNESLNMNKVSNHKINLNNKDIEKINFPILETNIKENYNVFYKNKIEYDFFQQNNSEIKNTFNSVNSNLHSNPNMPIITIPNNSIYLKRELPDFSKFNNSLYISNTESDFINNSSKIDKPNLVIKSIINSKKNNKNQDYLINTNNLHRMPIKINLNYNSKNTSLNVSNNKNITTFPVIEKLDNDISNNKEFNLTENNDDYFIKSREELLSNFDLNNIFSRNNSHLINDLKSKNAFDLYTGNKYEKNEIKDSIFKRSKNNPVYIWKKN